MAGLLPRVKEHRCLPPGLKTLNTAWGMGKVQEGSWATELGARDLNLPPTCSHLALGKHCSRGLNFLIGRNRSSCYAEFVRSLESGARDKAESNKAANEHCITYQIASLKGGTLSPDPGCGVREGIA